MAVRWAPKAADDLERIIRYIQEDDPDAARRVGLTIYTRAEGLMTLPNRGRPGRMDGTRELAPPPLPFIILSRMASTAGSSGGATKGGREASQMPSTIVAPCTASATRKSGRNRGGEAGAGAAGVVTGVTRGPRRGEVQSGRRDSNPRPPAPKAGALTRLRYAPIHTNILPNGPAVR